MPGNGREAEYSRKAFALIDRVSEHERDHIAAGYYEALASWTKKWKPIEWVAGTIPANGDFITN